MNFKSQIYCDQCIVKELCGGIKIQFSNCSFDLLDFSITKYRTRNDPSRSTAETLKNVECLFTPEKLTPFNSFLEKLSISYINA